MSTRFTPLFFLAVVLLGPAPLALAAPRDDLLTAAAAGNSVGVANALAAGADAKARDRDGLTALMLAARAGSFAACRELLWAGADATTRDPAGQTVLDHLGEVTEENVPLRLLLRCFSYLQANTKPAATKPARPALVMIMENTVNYLHPKLKAVYLINTAELNGRAGADDDRNGFVDDVYGWEPVTDKPYKIREEQFQTYLRHREDIARILQVDTDRVAGVITPQEAELRLAEFTNPLAEIMGPIDGLSDADFLDLVKNAAHGSHVAGIVVEASDGRAQLQTLAVNFAEETRRPLGPDTDRITKELLENSASPELLLSEIRSRLVAHNTSRGRIASRYLQATGAGVVNMSFGGGMPWWKHVAAQELSSFVERRQSFDPSYSLEADQLEELASSWGFELYVANAVELALLFYENPDVLFVCSAGNEDANNDESLVYPAYLARFFPNVITVAATNANNQITGFSNYGVLSVNVSAPGQDILSTVLPEASLYMSGTSMAAPYVSGVAALVRALAPTMKAAELRRLLEYTVSETEQLHHYTSSGGIVDREALRSLHTGTAAEQSNAYARMAINTARLDDDLYPHHQADADRFSQRAIDLDKNNAEAWRARAAYFDIAGQPKKAVEFIERAVKLAPDSEMAWVSRALIEQHLNHNDLAADSIARAIAVLEAQGSDSDLLRSRRLAWRAEILFTLGRTDEARHDAQLAHQLNEWVELSDDLQALL